MSHEMKKTMKQVKSAGLVTEDLVTELAAIADDATRSPGDRAAAIMELLRARGVVDGTGAGPLPPFGGVAELVLRPQPGDTVEYVDRDGNCFPGIITRAWSDTCVNLHVFFDDVYNVLPRAAVQTSVPLEEPGQDGPRWRWYEDEQSGGCAWGPITTLETDGAEPPCEGDCPACDAAELSAEDLDDFADGYWGEEHD